MSLTTLKKNSFVITLLCVTGGLLLVCWLSIFTQAQGKKNEKLVEVKDAVERLGPNQIRAKSGFRLVLIDDGWLVEQINGKEARRLEKRIKCGACPGGNCRSRLNGTCAPRNSCTSSTCLIDPF
ncbi:MAG TPA: hypothetical protein VFZ34_28625 [Blastocatellia bacterium]|nr:hypothetical protein [Blastocatellia bacterium]